MAKAKAKKPVKRKDGKPTRREKSRVNRGTYAAVRKALADARPEPKVLRAVTPDDLDAIIEAVAKGDTVRGKCRELCVSEGTVRMQIADDEVLSTRYARAKQQQAHAFAETNLEELEALDYVDTEADGANVKVAIAKHKFEVRKWTAGKYHVGAYGDKVTNVLEGNPEKPLRTITSDMDDAEAIAAYQESLRNRPR
jgi:hypothetical protein